MNRNELLRKCFHIAYETCTLAAAIGGTYAFIRQFISTDRSLLDILTSLPAIIVYLILLFAMGFKLLSLRYEYLNKEKEILNEKIAELNLKLSEESAKTEAALRNGRIAVFKKRFFLTTPKLYADIAKTINNEIVIKHLDIHNTIEKEGVGIKRDSVVTMSILAVSKKNNVSQLQILTAGDTIVKWSDINLRAYEIINEKRIPLQARLVDNSSDSYLKQVVISYSRRLKEGDLVNVVITWRWPNMLNIVQDDYTTLPIALSDKVEHISMKIESKMKLLFTEVGAYIYNVGMDSAELIMDLDYKVIVDSENNEERSLIEFEDDDPAYKSCYILYYKLSDD